MQDDSKTRPTDDTPQPEVAPTIAAPRPAAPPLSTRQRLSEAAAQLPPALHWRLDHLAAQHLRLHSDGQACRLQLRLTAYLQAPDTQRYAQIDLDLLSTPWLPTRTLPPPVVGNTPLPTPVEAAGHATLSYSLERAAPGSADNGANGSWLRYLGTPHPDSSASAGLPLWQQLEPAVAHWLEHTGAVQTVAGAEAAAFEGPLGYFGPLEAHLLERTGQLDLTVDATLLASADDAHETGGEPTTTLALYGERFGVWLLNRRSVKVLKAARRGAPAVQQWLSEVVVAESVEALLAQTGLGTVEKRLFRQAGLLQAEPLWPSRQSETTAGSTEAADSAPAAAAATTLDLSAVPDRPRRYLQAIVALAQQGKLDATDMDLLLRTARQLARARR